MTDGARHDDEKVSREQFETLVLAYEGTFLGEVAWYRKWLGTVLVEYVARGFVRVEPYAPVWPTMPDPSGPELAVESLRLVVADDRNWTWEATLDAFYYFSLTDEGERFKDECGVTGHQPHLLAGEPLERDDPS